MSGRRTIAVLGGGSAGFTAARTAARGGARVVWFLGAQPDRPSLCVNRGCMPSKAMFEPIDAMHRARRHGFFRIEPAVAGELLGSIIAWKDREIARFRAYRHQAIVARESEEFRVVRSPARFVAPRKLVSGAGEVEFDAAIIATGSVPRRPAIAGIDELGEELWDNEGLLQNRELPESIAFIGAGAIALEFALRYRRLGSRVTIIGRSRPLSAFPRAFGERITEIYEREGIRMLLGSRVRKVYRDTEGLYVALTEGDRDEPIAAERLALVAGRVPALDSLELEAGGIERTEDGGLDVGEDMRVRGQEHVFAAGDVLGRRMVVHQAHIEAGIAAHNAVDDGDRTWQRTADLQVVFSDPEFAYAGLTPRQAEAEGLETITGSKESRLVGKLHLGGDDHGFGEFIACRDSHRLLGAGLLCDDAANLIHLPAYVIDHRHTVHQAAAGEYYHPARIEIVSGILDSLCSALGGRPPERADERTG